MAELYTDIYKKLSTLQWLMKRHQMFCQTESDPFADADKRVMIVHNPQKDSTLSRGLALSSPLSFCQSFWYIFLHSAENSLFSKVLVDTARILW